MTVLPGQLSFDFAAGTCGKVVYPTANKLLSGYCGLKPDHEGECRYIPEEYVVQICKQILLERGEVVIPLRPRSHSAH